MQNHNWASQVAVDYMMTNTATLSQRWAAKFLSTKLAGVNNGERITRLKFLLGLGAQQVDQFEDTEVNIPGAGPTKYWDLPDPVGYINYTSGWHFLDLKTPGIYNPYDGYTFNGSPTDSSLGLDDSLFLNPLYGQTNIRSIRIFNYKIGKSTTKISGDNYVDSGCTTSQDHAKNYDEITPADYIVPGYKNYCDYNKIIYEPVTNLALYWAYRSMESGYLNMTEDNVKYVGHITHASQDVAVPHHVNITMGYLHTEVENTIRDHYARDDNYDGTLDKDYVDSSVTTLRPSAIISFQVNPLPIDAGIDCQSVPDCLKKENKLNHVNITDETYNVSEMLTTLGFRAFIHSEVFHDTNYSDSGSTAPDGIGGGGSKNPSRARWIANQGIANTILTIEKVVQDLLLGRNGLGGGNPPLEAPSSFDDLIPSNTPTVPFAGQPAF